MNPPMGISPAGIALIKQFEGLSLHAYRDIAGILTIGYGHTGPDVKPGMGITEAQATRLLMADLEKAINGVNSLLAIKVTQNQFDALVSFAYNLGVGALGGSTLLRRLNAGDILGAAEQFLVWNKARVNGVLQRSNGLIKRRELERKLFLGV